VRCIANLKMVFVRLVLEKVSKSMVLQKI
jgi:hypothetical protein